MLDEAPVRQGDRVSRSRGIRAKRWNHDPAAQSGELNNCALHFQRKEIIRCLKRYVARDIYRRLVGVDEQQKHPLSRPLKGHPVNPASKGGGSGLSVAGNCSHARTNRSRACASSLTPR